jgi:hypothetical protein
MCDCHQIMAAIAHAHTHALMHTLKQLTSQKTRLVHCVIISVSVLIVPAAQARTSKRA